MSLNPDAILRMCLELQQKKKEADIPLAGKDLVSFSKQLRKEGPKVDKADCTSLWTSSSSLESQLHLYYIMRCLSQTMTCGTGSHCGPFARLTQGQSSLFVIVINKKTTKMLCSLRPHT